MNRILIISLLSITWVNAKSQQTKLSEIPKWAIDYIMSHRLDEIMDSSIRFIDSGRKYSCLYDCARGEHNVGAANKYFILADRFYLLAGKVQNEIPDSVTHWIHVYFDNHPQSSSSNYKCKCQ
jgi:hypothetical protein